MTEPYCYRCGADKKQVCKDKSRLSCSAWGRYYGRHLWTDAKRQPKANDDAFIKLPPTTEELLELTQANTFEGMAPKSFITGNSEDTELIPQKHIIS